MTLIDQARVQAEIKATKEALNDLWIGYETARARLNHKIHEQEVELARLARPYRFEVTLKKEIEETYSVVADTSEEAIVLAKASVTDSKEETGTFIRREEKTVHWWAIEKESMRDCSPVKPVKPVAPAQRVLANLGQIGKLEDVVDYGTLHVGDEVWMPGTVSENCRITLRSNGQVVRWGGPGYGVRVGDVCRFIKNSHSD